MLYLLYGLGVLAAALLGGSSLVIQIPYTLPLLAVAIQGVSLEFMLFLGVIAGLGAGTGKLFAYQVADRVLAQHPDWRDNQYFRWVEQFTRQFPHFIVPLVFVVIATPIPDEAVILPLATIRYGLRGLLLPLYAGKITHNVVVAMLFYHFTDYCAAHINQSVVSMAATSLILLLVFGLLYQLRPFYGFTMTKSPNT